MYAIYDSKKNSFLPKSLNSSSKVVNQQVKNKNTQEGYTRYFVRIFNN